MRRVAFKGLWLRRGRATLTALAVVLGVAMVCGTYVLTDTISKAFDNIFETGASKTSAVITGKQVVSGSTSGAATVDQSLVAKVRDVDGVAAVTGAISGSGTADQIRLIGSDGKALGSENSPKLGFGFEPSATRFNPLNLVQGQWANGNDQVVIDKGTADDEHLKVGSTVGVAARGTRQPFKVVGIAKYGDVNSLGGATIGVFDLPTAQRLLDKPGQVDTIYVAASPGVSPKEVVTNLEPVVPKSATVRTAADQAAEDSKDIKEATSFIQYFLLAFAVIALGVGSFVIYNTLSITVAQRIRELATLRTLGASRKQVRRSVLLEGLAIGVIASVVGLVMGWFLAKGLGALFVALGIDLPKTDEVLRTRTIVVSLALGIVVTVLASLSPARRATSIPVAALQEGATLPPRLGARRPVIPALVIGLAVALLLVGAFGSASIGLSLRPDRRRDAAGVRRRRDDRSPRCAPAGAGARRPGPTCRRGRPARGRERDAQPAAHGDHRRGADDRARARDARGDARPGPARVGPQGARGRDDGRLRDHRRQRLRPDPVDRRPRRRAGSGRQGVPGALRPRQGVRRRRQRQRAATERQRRGQGARQRRAGRTGPRARRWSRRATRRTTGSRSARGSRSRRRAGASSNSPCRACKSAHRSRRSTRCWARC